VSGTAAAATAPGDSASVAPLVLAAATAPTRGWRRGCGAGGKGRGGRRCRSNERHDGGRSTQGEFLELEFGAYLGKGGKWPLSLEVGAEVSEAVIQATEDVDDEEAVGDGLAELDEGVSECFHLAAVIRDGESALHQGAELGVDEDDPGFTIADELFFEGEPGGAGGRRGGSDDLEQLGGDGAVEPREDVEIHLDPVRDSGIGGIAQDVVGKRVLAEGEEEKASPLGEGRRGEVKQHRHESTDVEDAESLGVQG
jgi:hypothetical protein